MAIPSGPKGTRDFYPELMTIREYIFGSWKKTCLRYGFEPYDGPLFEHLELYTQKSGDEIEKQLYAFKDKGGRTIALRPELTPTLARMVAAMGQNLKRPIRWYSIPRLFRYEKMQKGRLREFFQLNMDILGIEDVSADAELIAASIDMMKDLGLTSADFKVRISSRTLLEQAFSSFGVSPEQTKSLYALLDRKSKVPPAEYAEELAETIPDQSMRASIDALFDAKSLDDIVKRAGPLPSINELRELFELLGCYGFSDYVMFDIGIVRGLAYYTGIVFELFDISKSMRAIAGGGRYDKLVQLYGGQPTPATGFAAGDVVLGELLAEKGIAPVMPPRSLVYIIGIEGTPVSEIIKTSQELRNNGISCEFPLKEANIGRQLKNANAARAVTAVFIGGDEAIKGQVRIKDMRSGNEILVNRSELIENVKKIVGI